MFSSHHSKLCRTSVAHSDVPLLFFLCFRQHMIPIIKISTPPTAAMTPIMTAKNKDLIESSQ